jgi:SAM-dependent methyltransferase
MGIEADYYEHHAGSSPEDVVRKTQLQDPKELERAEKLAAWLPAETDSVLDVGCGGGLALSTIRTTRPEIAGTGLERSTKMAEAARSLFGLDVVEGSADALPFEDDSFDMVLANEVLEHLPWGVYEATLLELQRVARKGILITTPYRERRQFVTCPKCRCSFSPFYHLRSFDDEALGGLFENFERVEQELIYAKGRAPLLYEARRLKAALGGVPPLPRSTICPQCGYRRAAKKAQSDAESAQDGRPPAFNRILSGAWGLIPRPRRAKWVIARYAPKV